MAAVVLVWLALALLTGYLLGRLNLADLSHPDANTRTTSGIVAGKFPRDHARIDFLYSVDGIQYRGSDSFIGSPNPSFDDIKVEDPVVVFYQASDPTNAVLSQPTKRLHNETGAVIVAAIIVPTAFMLAALVPGVGFLAVRKLLTRRRAGLEPR